MGARFRRAAFTLACGDALPSGDAIGVEDCPCSAAGCLGLLAAFPVARLLPIAAIMNVFAERRRESGHRRPG
jgi:hypothetical protein